jgi:[ribosomal protein S18]-alanine N-acetyltransferase
MERAEADRLVVERIERAGALTEELTRLAREAFSGPSFSPVDELERSWARVWVARAFDAGEEAKPVGFLVAWHVVDELHVLNVATSSDARRRGIGSRLVREALAYAAANGVRLVLLEVRRSNEAAIRLYEKHAFVVSGVRERYYSDNDEDALEMRLELAER